MGYRDPTEEEKRNPSSLIGSRVAIWWDGDNVFYPCQLLTYNSVTSTCMVLYENDATNQQYEENLNETRWKLWDNQVSNDDESHLVVVGSNTSNVAENASSENNVTSESTKKAVDYRESKRDKRTPKLSYSEMVIEAVSTLAAQDRNIERDGSSIQAIRKFIISTYNLGKQQTASFNNLTLKAITRATAIGDLEANPRARHSFRLTAACKRKRDAKLRPALSKSAGLSAKVKFLYASPKAHPFKISFFFFFFFFFSL